MPPEIEPVCGTPYPDGANVNVRTLALTISKPPHFARSTAGTCETDRHSVSRITMHEVKIYQARSRQFFGWFVAVFTCLLP